MKDIPVKLSPIWGHPECRIYYKGNRYQICRWVDVSTIKQDGINGKNISFIGVGSNIKVDIEKVEYLTIPEIEVKRQPFSEDPDCDETGRESHIKISKDGKRIVTGKQPQ